MYLNLFFTVFISVSINKFVDLSKTNSPSKLNISIKEFKEILDTNVWDSLLARNPIQSLDDVKRFQYDLLQTRNAECFFTQYGNMDKVNVDNNMLDSRDKLMKSVKQLENMTVYENLILQSFSEMVSYSFYSTYSVYINFLFF